MSWPKGKKRGPQSEQHRKNLSNSCIGRSSWRKNKKFVSLSEETKQKMSLSHKIFWSLEERRSLQSKRMKDLKYTSKCSLCGKEFDSPIKLGGHIAGAHKKSDEHKKKLSEHLKNFNKLHNHNRQQSNDYREKRKLITKKLWEDQEYRNKVFKSVIPNKSELKLLNILNELYPLEWQFVGDGKLIINGKIPDFVNINGRKLIIELFGYHWHQEDNSEDRVKVFEPFGYKTLIIWEPELKNSEVLKNKIMRFIQ